MPKYIRRKPSAKNIIIDSEATPLVEPQPEPVTEEIPPQDLTVEKAAEFIHEYERCHANLWEGRDVCVLFPCYRETNPATTWTLVAIALDLGREKVRFDMEIGDAMIYHARNKLAHRFLESGATWALWIDSDTIAPIGREPWTRWVANLSANYPSRIAAAHIIPRLIGHNKTIVGGTYFGRQASGRVVSSAHYHPAQADSARRMDGQLIPVDWVGTGCLLVHRQVFLDIQKTFPELGPCEWHKSKEAVVKWKREDGLVFNEWMEGSEPFIESVRDVEVAPRKEWDYFCPKLGKGEDVSFCERARTAGHQVYLDTGLQCQHVGYNCWNATNTGKKKGE